MAPRTGRPPRLTDAEKKRLAAALEAGALAQGYATDLWTLARVGKLIEKISSKRYSASGVWRLIKGLNFSCQRSSGRASKRDEAAIQHWKKKRWPALKNVTAHRYLRDGIGARRIDSGRAGTDWLRGGECEAT